MKLEMATRNPTDTKVAKEGCTEFVLHKSQQAIFDGCQEKIVDYAEHRLIRCAIATKDPQQKLVLMALIQDYRDGKVAIAWRKGAPVYIRVTRA